MKMVHQIGYLVNSLWEQGTDEIRQVMYFTSFWKYAVGNAYRIYSRTFRNSKVFRNLELLCLAALGDTNRNGKNVNSDICSYSHPNACV